MNWIIAKLAMAVILIGAVIGCAHPREKTNVPKTVNAQPGDQPKGAGEPSDAVGYFNRGVEDYEKRDFVRAILDFDKAIHLQPDFAEAYNGRGKAYYSKENYAHAISDCSKAIQLKPDYADAYTNRGAT